MNQTTLAVVFPGQGSQSVGMLSDLASDYPLVEQTFAEASTVLGYDLWQLVQTGPSAVLDQTIHTQPALLAASFAIWRLLQSHSACQPAMLAGHSLGEYTALVCAGALSFEEGIRLVAARGKFMQEAVGPGMGAMAAIIGLEDEEVKAICDEVKQDEVLAPANFNSLGQVVIAGHKVAVERAVRVAKEKGAKLAMMLSVSVPSHCALMQPAAQRLSDLLQTIPFNKTSIPVINNVDVRPYADNFQDGLTRQLVSPVRWVETIGVFREAGITQILECGPGKILTGLNKRIDKEFGLATTHDAASVAAWLAEKNGGKGHVSG